MENTQNEYVSKEEFQFSEWVREAVEHSLLEPGWEYQPVTWELIPKQTVHIPRQLKTKTKWETKVLAQKHSYTPDFKIHPTDKGLELLKDVFKYAVYMDDYKKTGDIYIDVKGYMVQNSQQQMFSCNRKMVAWQKNLWVVKIVPYRGRGSSLFTQTFCPESLRYKQSTSEPTLTKKGEQCNTVEQFLENGPNKK